MVKKASRVALRLFVAAFGASALSANTASAQGSDAAAWRTVERQNTAAAYSDFLRRYPTSQYAGTALARLMQLDAPPQPGRAQSLNRSYIMY